MMRWQLQHFVYPIYGSKYPLESVYCWHNKALMHMCNYVCTCTYTYVCNIYVCQRANSQMNSSASNCVYSSPCSFTSSDDTGNDINLCSFLPISTMKSSRTFLRMHNWVLPGLIPNKQVCMYIHTYMKMHNAMYDTNNCIRFKPLCM